MELQVFGAFARPLILEAISIVGISGSRAETKVQRGPYDPISALGGGKKIQI